MVKMLRNKVFKELAYATLVLLLSLGMFGIATSPANAATSATVTITAAPAFVGITNDPNTWTINGLTHSGFVKNNTVYWSNPTDDQTTPTAGGATDGQCRFTLTNASTVPTNITLSIADFSGGDAIKNGNIGTSNTTHYGAYGYYSGLAMASKVIAQSSGSDPLIVSLAGLTNKKWGIEIKMQTVDWTSATNMTAVATITAISSE
jgi:uncharacterized membrane protein